MLYASTGPPSSVTGAASSARPGIDVVHARFAPCGHHSACVTNGFVPWRTACGHHANIHTKSSGSRP